MPYSPDYEDAENMFVLCWNSEEAEYFWDIEGAPPEEPDADD
jgi:hypothetical protein